MEWLIGISALIGAGTCILLGAVALAYLWENERIDVVGRIIVVVVLLCWALATPPRADAETIISVVCVGIGLALCIAICAACIRYLWDVSIGLWSTKPGRAGGVIVIALLSTTGIAAVAAAYAKLYDNVVGVHVGGYIPSVATEAARAARETSRSTPQRKAPDCTAIGQSPCL